MIPKRPGRRRPAALSGWTGPQEARPPARAPGRHPGESWSTWSSPAEKNRRGRWLFFRSAFAGLVLDPNHGPHLRLFIPTAAAGPWGRRKRPSGPLTAVGHWPPLLGG